MKRSQVVWFTGMNYSVSRIKRSFGSRFLMLAIVWIASVSVHAQLIPASDADLEELGGGFHLVELFAAQCDQFDCPNIDCSEAINLAGWLLMTKNQLMLYAFWLSKTPEFESSQRYQTRYKKTVSLIRRIDGLIEGVSSDGTSGRSLIRCFGYLGKSCNVLERAKTLISRENEGFVRSEAAEVVFPSSGEPSEGTAKHPEKWAEALRHFDQGFPRSRIFFHSFVFPEDQRPSIVTKRTSFEMGVSHQIDLTVPICSRHSLQLVVIPATADRSGPIKYDQSWFSYRIEYYGHIKVRIPPLPPNRYELRLVNRSTSEQLAFSPFIVNVTSQLVGVWESRPDLELEIRIERDKLVAYRREPAGESLICRDFGQFEDTDHEATFYSAVCLVSGEDKNEWLSFRLELLEPDSIKIESGRAILEGLQTRSLLTLKRAGVSN